MRINKAAAVMILLLLAAPAMAAQVTLTAQADAYTDMSSPSSNFGTQTSMAVYYGASDSHSAYLKFNSAAIPPYSLNSARFYFYKSFGSGSPNFVLEECASSWTESALTYDTAPGVTGSAISKAISGGNGWYFVDILPFVINWAGGTNNGLRITNSVLNTSIMMTSKEGTTGYAPYVLVDYNPPGTPTASPTDPGPTQTITCTPTNSPVFTLTQTMTVTPTITPIAPDAFENDDTYMNAKDIYNGVQQVHSFSYTGDTDWVKITLAASSTVNIQTSGPAAVDTELTLYNSAGVPVTELAYNDDYIGTFSRINIWLSAGTYYVKVNEYGNNSTALQYYLNLTTTLASPTFTRTGTRTITQTSTHTPFVTATPTKTITQTHSITPTWSQTATPITLQDAVDNYTLTFTTGGYANWFGERNDYYYDNDAAQSGPIGHSQYTYMQTTVTGPGTCTFYWKVGSESGYDYLRFYIDSTQYDSISGFTSWTLKTFSIPAGTHVLKWQYSKDGSVAYAPDAGYVDRIIYSPQVSPTITQTLSVTVTGTITETFTVTPVVSATPTFTITETHTITMTPTPYINMSFTSSGLWHQIPDSSAPTSRIASSASPNTWWYGRDATGNYDTGSINSGDLTSGSWYILPSQKLVFYSWEQTENSTAYDKRRVYVSVNSGATWTMLRDLYGSENVWYRVEIDLSAYSGMNAIFRFNFDTIDSVSNSYKGWYVDDVRLAAIASPLPTSTATPSVTRTNTATITPTHTVTKTATVTFTSTIYLTATVTVTLTPTPTRGINNERVSPGYSYVYPQPVYYYGNIAYNTGAAADVTIRIYNAAGMPVAQFADVTQGDQISRKSFDASGFAPGVYYYTIGVDAKNGGFIKMKPGKFMVTR